MVAGNKYLQCDELDDGKIVCWIGLVDWLSGVGVEGTVQNVLKEGEWKNGVEKLENLLGKMAVDKSAWMKAWRGI